MCTPTTSPNTTPCVGDGTRGGPERDDLRDTALEDRPGLGDVRNIDDPRRRGRHAGEDELVDVRSDWSGGRVHGFGEVSADQVPAELAGRAGVRKGVLRPVAGEADDRRRVVEGGEEAVRRKVQCPLGGPA